MKTLQEVQSRSICIGKAANVKNVLDHGMQGFEGCVSMNNGVVAFVVNGNYYLTPDGHSAHKTLTEAGFEDATFMVICSADPEHEAPNGHEVEWRRLRETRPKE